MDLIELRQNIDRIDSEIVWLLNQRMEFALRTKKLKAQIPDLEREKQVIAGIRQQAYDLLRPDFSGQLFQEIIAETKRVQEQHKRLIGFQGEHGAYSELAVRSFDFESIPIPHKEFVDVFSAVRDGTLDLGMIPVENSIAGSVTQVNDLLLETDLHVLGEVYLDVHHCLLALPDTDYRDIRVVYSHPQALEQCRGFLSRTELEVRPYYDTAGAAMMLARERPQATAAIASQFCERLYNLEILKENIEDDAANTTRFLVLSANERNAHGDKCSVIFSTPHTPGALYNVIRMFAESGVNLTRIESRRLPKQPGRYAFLLDFQGKSDDPKTQAMMEQVARNTTMFRILGWYHDSNR